jgi:hypothetical protein
MLRRYCGARDFSSFHARRDLASGKARKLALGAFKRDVCHGSPRRRISPSDTAGGAWTQTVRANTRGGRAGACGHNRSPCAAKTVASHEKGC